MRPAAAIKDPLMQTNLAPNFVTKLATTGPLDKYTAIYQNIRKVLSQKFALIT